MPVVDWTPDLGDVGSILRARTVNADGAELGTFTADTRPNSLAIADLIQQATADVHSQVGEVAPALWPLARRVSAIGVALMVELSYFPEQVASGRSPYEQLKALYDEMLARLNVADEDVDADGVLDGNDPDTPMSPSWYFGDGGAFRAPGAEYPGPWWPLDGPGRYVTFNGQPLYFGAEGG